jgi:hypothetical protein
LIPIFASVYYFLLPNDFYHSTVQFEYPTMNKTANRILEGLQESITQRIGSTQDGGKCGAWQLLPDTLRVHSLNGHDGKVSFAISGTLVTNSIGHAEYYFSNRFSVTLNQRLISLPPGGPVTVGFFPTSEEPMPFKSPAGEIDLAVCLFPRGQHFAIAPLEIPRSLMDDIGGFATAIRGFPAHVEG